MTDAPEGLREEVLFYVSQAKTLGSNRADAELTDEILALYRQQLEGVKAAAKKRELFEPVTNRLVSDGDKVGIDLEADQRGSLKFIQDNGYNMAVDDVHGVIDAEIRALK